MKPTQSALSAHAVQANCCRISSVGLQDRSSRQPLGHRARLSGRFLSASRHFSELEVKQEASSGVRAERSAAVLVRPPALHTGHTQRNSACGAALPVRAPERIGQPMKCAFPGPYVVGGKRWPLPFAEQSTPRAVPGAAARSGPVLTTATDRWSGPGSRKPGQIRTLN